jgi:hypothetical protein
MSKSWIVMSRNTRPSAPYRRVLVVLPGPKLRLPEDPIAHTVSAAMPDPAYHERLGNKSQEIRDASEEEAEAGGHDRQASQG